MSIQHLVGKKVRILSTNYSKPLDLKLVGSIRVVEKVFGDEVVGVRCEEHEGIFSDSRDVWAIPIQNVQVEDEYVSPN